MEVIQNQKREIEILNKIKTLTAQDLQNKSLLELYASATEELGELSRELKIEFKTHGNTYKKPDEGVKAEAVDLAICAYCLFYAVNGFVNANFILPRSPEVYEILGELKPIIFKRLGWAGKYCGLLGDMMSHEQEYCLVAGFVDCDLFQEYAEELVQEAIGIFGMVGGKYEELLDLLEKKLGKWENSK